MSQQMCPWCKYQGKIFGASYLCEKTQEDIYTGSEVYKQYCNAYEDNWKQCPHFGPQPVNNGGCYLTSACVEAMGLSDDCMELTTLRQFRDGWLSNQPGGEVEIREYYRIAPGIVDNIHAHSDPIGIFKDVYFEMVLPCVRLIEARRFEDARTLYRRKTRELESTYNR